MKRSSKFLAFASCVFSVLVMSAGLAHADRIYPLNHPAVSWDSSSSRCYVNGVEGRKVSTSATQNMPGGYGCRINSSIIILVDPSEAVLNDYVTEKGYACEDTEGSEVVCELVSPDTGDDNDSTCTTEAAPQEPSMAGDGPTAP